MLSRAPVVAGTLSFPFASPSKYGDNLEEDHVYVVESVGDREVTLYNPYGYQLVVSHREFKTFFSYLVEGS